jgi:Spy/CpxP family protein refolding chaperone
MTRPSRTILFVAVLALLALPVIAFATPAATSSDTTTVTPPAGGHHFHARGAAAGFTGVLKQLSLTADQKTKVHAIMTSHSDAMKANFQQMHEAHTALSNAINADKYDESAVRAASQSMSAVMEEMAVMHAQIQNEIRPVLTADQVAKAKQIIATQQAKSQARSAARAQRQSSAPQSN